MFDIFKGLAPQWWLRGISLSRVQAGRPTEFERAILYAQPKKQVGHSPRLAYLWVYEY